MTQQVKIQCLRIENTEYECRYSQELSIEIDEVSNDYIVISVDGENDSTLIKLDKRQVSLLCLNLQELRYEMQ
jgi:hypothetical protein